MATNHEFLKVVAEEEAYISLYRYDRYKKNEQAVKFFDEASCPITLMHTVAHTPPKKSI